MLTRNVNGEVVWVEEGSHSAIDNGPFSYNFGYSYSSNLVSDVYTMTLDLIPGSEC